MSEPRVPQSLTLEQRDFVRAVNTVFGDVTEAYVVLVLAGVLPALSGLKDPDKEQIIRTLAKIRNVEIE